MPYDRKPSNWWQMDYDERKEWERNKQAFEDAEYDRQRAQEAADNAHAEAQRLRRSMQEERASQYEEYSILQDEYQELNENYERVLRERKQLRDALFECVTQLELEDWDGEPPSYLVAARALLDSITGD